MTKKSDAPAIRFKGFSDAWEQRKLGDMLMCVVNSTNEQMNIDLWHYSK